ncbi:molecular chaperone [Vibrio owensii]|uniref:molecular chaperone n=1 Tax=Vibrio owensii TaxID=696485 RepID=UPI0005EFEA30|nr:molecular chaperone [Vibrio owensii]
MKKIIKFACLISALIGGTANAGIAISSMIEFTENGITEFNITNVEEYRQFIHVQARELQVGDKGELITVPYTRDNLEQWSLFVNPARAIVEPSGKKAFRVRYQALPNNDKTKDKAYQLSFIPTPYFGESSEKNSAVQVAVGFAPFVVVPAEEDQALKYTIKHNGESLTVENKGKTYIRGYLDACPADIEKSERDDCQKMVYVLSGRKLDVDLPENMQHQIEVNFSTHHSKFKDKFDLENGEEKYRD